MIAVLQKLERQHKGEDGDEDDAVGFVGGLLENLLETIGTTLFGASDSRGKADPCPVLSITCGSKTVTHAANKINIKLTFYPGSGEMGVTIVDKEMEGAKVKGSSPKHGFKWPVDLCSTLSVGAKKGATDVRTITVTTAKVFPNRSFVDAGGRLQQAKPTPTTPPDALQTIADTPTFTLEVKAKLFDPRYQKMVEAHRSLAKQSISRLPAPEKRIKTYKDGSLAMLREARKERLEELSEMPCLDRRKVAFERATKTEARLASRKHLRQQQPGQLKQEKVGPVWKATMVCGKCECTTELSDAGQRVDTATGIAHFTCTSLDQLEHLPTIRARAKAAAKAGQAPLPPPSPDDGI